MSNSRVFDTRPVTPTSSTPTSSPPTSSPSTSLRPPYRPLSNSPILKIKNPFSSTPTPQGSDHAQLSKATGAAGVKLSKAGREVSAAAVTNVTTAAAAAATAVAVAASSHPHYYNTQDVQYSHFLRNNNNVTTNIFNIKPSIATKPPTTSFYTPITTRSATTTLSKPPFSTSDPQSSNPKAISYAYKPPTHPSDYPTNHRKNLNHKYPPIYNPASANGSFERVLFSWIFAPPFYFVRFPFIVFS